MITKPQNILRSLLAVPYLAWGIALLFVYLDSASAETVYNSNALFEALMGIASFYTIGIFLWGIPYTILVLGLLLWSIKKPAATIYKMFVFSPILLSILTLIEIALVLFWPPQTLSHESFTDFLSYFPLAIIPILVIGYGFVGIGIGIYKTMRYLNFMRIEGETI